MEVACMQIKESIGSGTNRRIADKTAAGTTNCHFVRSSIYSINNIPSQKASRQVIKFLSFEIKKISV